MYIIFIDYEKSNVLRVRKKQNDVWEYKVSTIC